MRLAQARGPASWSSRRNLRAGASSFLASGTQRELQAPICTMTGSRAMDFSVVLFGAPGALLLSIVLMALYLGESQHDRRA